MKINLEFDEAEIVRKCLDGLSKKEIKEKIIRDVLFKATNKIAEKVYKQFAPKLTRRDYKLLEKAIEEVAKKKTNENLELFARERFSETKVEDMVYGYISDMIEEYFEYSPVTFEFKFKNKTQKVDVLSSKVNQRKL